jgi:hypothetical protein
MLTPKAGTGLIIVYRSVTAPLQTIGTDVVVLQYHSRLVIVDRSVTAPLQAIGSDIVALGKY